MSVKHYWLKNEDGAPSFLCGAMSVLCEAFNNAHCDKGPVFHVCADVFYIGRQNEIPLKAALEARFTSYMHNVHVDDPQNFNDSINNLSPSLQRSKQSFAKSMISAFEKVTAVDSALICDIENFCASIGYFFSKPMAVFCVKNESFKENPLIKEYYWGNAKEILFVEFSEYILMLSIGSCDRSISK